MKKLTFITLLGVITLSCGEADKKQANTDATLEKKTIENETNELKTSSNTTILCKINGEEWAYTSGDGLVSRNSSTNVRTATIGFRKQLEKGYESIQVEYDVDKNELNTVLVELKRPSKDGKMKTVFYTQYRNKLHLKPGASLTGTVSLNEDARKASGTAEITIFIQNGQNELENTGDQKITISNLKFSNIPYSDTDDLKKLMKK